MLHKKETTQEALKLLYRYNRTHPAVPPPTAAFNALSLPLSLSLSLSLSLAAHCLAVQTDMEEHLSKTSDVFKQYIQRGLKRVEEAERVHMHMHMRPRCGGR